MLVFARLSQSHWSEVYVDNWIKSWIHVVIADHCLCCLDAHAFLLSDIFQHNYMCAGLLFWTLQLQAVRSMPTNRQVFLSACIIVSSKQHFAVMSVPVRFLHLMLVRIVNDKIWYVSRTGCPSPPKISQATRNELAIPCVAKKRNQIFTTFCPNKNVPQHQFLPIVSPNKINFLQLFSPPFHGCLEYNLNVNP